MIKVSDYIIEWLKQKWIDIKGEAYNYTEDVWEKRNKTCNLKPVILTNEEFDRMIIKESENLDMWTLNSVIGYNQNRAISYPANYFHSKYPNKSWKSGREVFVMFYKTKEI